MEYVQPIGGAVNDPYVDANPGAGTEGSAVPAAAIEDPMRELVSLIVDVGIVPDSADLTQVTKAVRMAIQRLAASSAAAGGTADAVTAAFTPTVVLLTNGMTLHVRAGAVNTSTTPTFTPAAGTIAAKTIVKGNNLPLVVGDIAGAGHWLELKYDSTFDKWILINPATGVVGALGTGYMLLRDEKASGTTGGASIAGVQTRTLNTVSANTIAGASLSSNQITLPAGTYRITASAPAANVNNHQAYLYNVTDSAISMMGTSEQTTAIAATDWVATSSVVKGRIVLATSKVFELRHNTGGVYSSGLGVAASTGTEVYSWIEILKES